MEKQKMPNKKQSSCGAVEMLKNLRETQEKINSNIPSIDKYISKVSKSKIRDVDNKINNMKIYEINPLDIIRWKHKDRPENELENIEELAETFKNIGQQQPCIVRKQGNKYELIVGERRWRAAKKIGSKLKVIIQDIDDRMASLIQAIENEKRQDISDYAKGMSYHNKINAGLISHKDLIDILKVPKMQVTRLLSFVKIPKELKDSINDFRKISARTSYELMRFSSKGKEYIDILIRLSDKLRTGKFGHNSIKNAVEKARYENIKEKERNKKIIAVDGRHLFTLRIDKNNSPSIHFSKKIMCIMEDHNLSVYELTDDIKKIHIKKTT